MKKIVFFVIVHLFYSYFISECERYTSFLVMFSFELTFTHHLVPARFPFLALLNHPYYISGSLSVVIFLFFFLFVYYIVVHLSHYTLLRFALLMIILLIRALYHLVRTPSSLFIPRLSRFFSSRFRVAEPLLTAWSLMHHLNIPSPFFFQSPHGATPLVFTRQNRSSKITASTKVFFSGEGRENCEPILCLLEGTCVLVVK